MRFCILVSALCLLTSSFAKGQWLEDVVKVGDGPSAVAWSYPYVYVANRYSNSLSVLDQDADSVVTSMTVDNEPVLLAADEWQHELYCACRLGPSLHIVCSDSNAIVANLPLNGEPSAMCLSGYPARRLFVAGFNSIRCNTTVTVIDLDLRRVAAELDVPGEVSSLWHSGDNADRLYCADPARQCVWVLSVPGESLVRLYPAGAGACALTSSSYGRLYCANRWDGTVTVIDLAGDSVRTVLDVGAQPVTLVDYYGYIYCANSGSDNVTVIDNYSVRVVNTIHTGAEPCLCFVDGMWNKLQVVNARNHTLTVHDLWSGESLASHELPAGPFAATRVQWEWLNKLFIACEQSNSVAVFADSIQIVGNAESSKGADMLKSPSIVRGVLWLPRDMGLGTRSGLSDNPVMSRAALLDIGGRKVTDLRPGPNDVRALAPGVYFVRSVVSNRWTAAKVIVQ